MKYDKDSVIISDSLNGLGTDIYKEYGTECSSPDLATGTHVCLPLNGIGV